MQRHTRVTDLGPLSALPSLKGLSCSGTRVRELPEALVWLDSLQALYLSDTNITDIPPEVLSPNVQANCLGSVEPTYGI